VVGVSLDEPSDFEVLAVAAAGDPQSFAVLWDRHRDRVFGHALRLTRVRADAEDATAIVFLEAWRKQSRIRDVDGSILPWLLVTTTNVCRNLHRAARRYRAALDQIPHVTDKREPTGTDLDLQAALRTLPPIDQQLLGLTLEGYSTAEAAQAAGLSPGAARTRITRARQRLRTQLDPAPVADIAAQEGPR
jgi:RNA polymerase sigma factor (sigma-70 family)